MHSVPVEFSVGGACWPPCVVKGSVSKFWQHLTVVLRVEVMGAISKLGDDFKVLIIEALYHKHSLKNSCGGILGKIKLF